MWHTSSTTKTKMSMSTTTKVKCIQEFPKYIDIGEILNYNPAATSVNEPAMFNPNSKDSLKKILQHLKTILIDNGDGRKWVFVGSDGPPYTILRRIIEEEPAVYNWVVLVSGKGHLNMNQLKTFFKVLDHVCGDVLGNDVLQFNTPKSYKYFIDCKDNHKAWQAFEIFLHGTTMEIIRLYASELPSGVNPGVMGFLDWMSSVLSPTLQFMTQFTFNFALAIYVQRIGDRNNDEKCSDAGRFKFNDMFYAFNHPIYREVEYNELRQRILFPSEIGQLRQENITYSNINGVTRNNHEGGDFKLENQIKRIKSLAPKGRISEDIWKKLIRCSTDVSACIDHGKKLLGLNSKDVSRKTSIEHEIAKYRACLRYNELLTQNSQDVVNTKREKLNESLITFTTCLKDKRKLYWKNVLDGVPLQSIRYENLNIMNTDDDDELVCYGYSDDSESDRGTSDIDDSDDE